MAFDGTISYEGDVAPPYDIVQQAVRCADDTRTLKTTASLRNMTKAFDLSDGTQVYVLDLEHVRKVHIVPPSVYEPSAVGRPDPVPDYPGEPTPIVGVLSGVGIGTTIESRSIDWPHDLERGSTGVPNDTDDAVINDRFTLTRETEKYFPSQEASYKLAVDANSIFAEVGDDERRVQWRHVIPGRYTGAMSAIVQLLLGVGRLVRPDYEERWSEATGEPTLYEPSELNWYGSSEGAAQGGHSEASTSSDVSGYLADGYDGTYESMMDDESFFKVGDKVQVTYDYRWNRTHGVMWGKNNKGESVPMLVEFAQRGIHVMPFPIDAISRKQRVQDQYNKVYPSLNKYAPFKGRSETLFEAFGGFPTGENFPGYHEEFDRWVRAGRAIGDAEGAADFYNDAISMCTGFGWAFHPTAPRAINTCYRYVDEHKVGYCYEFTLEITEKSDAAKIRNPYYDMTVAALQLTEEIDLYKAARLPAYFAEQMIEKPDYNAFDAFEVSPDWIVRIMPSEVREGIIDYPYYQCPRPPGGACDVIGSPHFKYFEPMLGVVLNFMFENEAYHGAEYEADGPIFATYTDSGAEILSYYYDSKLPGPAEYYNTRQPCQYVGSWTTGSRSEGSTLAGYFYCTSKDFRKTLNRGSGSDTKWTMVRTGHNDYAAGCSFFPIQITLSRNYYGYETWSKEAWSRKGYGVSASCSATSRSAFFICTEDHTSEYSATNGETQHRIIGSSGQIRRGMIYNWVWHWVNCGNYFCDSIDVNRYRVCEDVIANPESCFGTAKPSDLVYSVHGCQRGEECIISSPVGPNHIIVSAVYAGTNPTGPLTGWSTQGDTVWLFDWEVWAFGLDLMHNIKLKSGHETIMNFDELPQYSSHTSWWRCSLDDCRAIPWYVGQNFFGKPYVTAYDDIDMSNVVEFGVKPETGMGPMNVPFGVVE